MKINLGYAKTETPSQVTNKKKWFESEHDLRSRIKTYGVEKEPENI